MHRDCKITALLRFNQYNVTPESEIQCQWSKNMGVYALKPSVIQSKEFRSYESSRVASQSTITGGKTQQKSMAANGKTIKIKLKLWQLWTALSLKCCFQATEEMDRLSRELISKNVYKTRA